MAAINVTMDGRKIRVVYESGNLVLVEKVGRGKPPNVVRHGLLRLMEGSLDSVLDDLLRKLPIADLDGIRPEKVGYELKARLLALLKPKIEIHEEAETADASEATDPSPRRVDRRVGRGTGRRSKRGA